MYTFNNLVEAQKHAKDNGVQQYWRVIFLECLAGRGGWWTELDPRERFYFSLDQLRTDADTWMRGGRGFTYTRLFTDEVSDSPNAR